MHTTVFRRKNMALEELMDEIDTLESNVEELADLAPANDQLRAVTVGLWVDTLRLLAVSARELAKKPNQSEETVAILRMIVLLGDGLKQAVEEIPALWKQIQRTPTPTSL